MGIFISGTPSCAITELSSYSTAECTTLCLWTTISICSGLSLKSHIASINSRPLFISVAESMVIFLPIDQLGWLRACSTVTPSRSNFVLPKNGPPEAVRIIPLSLLPSFPCRHWKIAECSLSTGYIFTPFSAAAFITSSPPATSVSLFARAMSVPFSIAVRVGTRPTMPTTELSMISTPSILAISLSPSMPVDIFMPVPLRSFSSSDFLSSR